MPGRRRLGGISLVPKEGGGGEAVTAEKRMQGKARERKGKAYQLTMCFTRMPKRLAFPLSRFVATMPGCTL